MLEPAIDFTGRDVNQDELADIGEVVDFTPGRDYFFVQFDDDPRWAICFLDRARRPVRLATASDEIYFTVQDEYATVPPRGTRITCRIFPHGHGRFKASAWALRTDCDDAPLAA